MADPPDAAMRGEGEPKIMRGPRAHSVAWVLNDEWLDGIVTCHAGEGADCRLDCPEGCAEWDILTHDHALRDSGRCLVVEWIENTGVMETHTGTHAPVDGFIEVAYDDGYSWSYADD
jgi:hypothetical protein